MPAPLLDASALAGTLIGRVWRGDKGGPALVTLRNGALIDITSRAAPTVSALLERSDALDYVKTFLGENFASLETVAVESTGRTDAETTHLLAPCDLQPIKACGVTFAQSMVERVIEEKAAGNADRAQAIRQRIGGLIGDSLANLRTGSEAAARVKQALVEEGVWSQYLEVGIGPDAEVFTKSPLLSAVGWGLILAFIQARAGTIRSPKSSSRSTAKERSKARAWAMTSICATSKAARRYCSARLKTTTRPVRSDHLSGCSIRVGASTMFARRNCSSPSGEDGFVLDGHSAMKKISRDPLDLVAQTCGPHHQYPDGFMLFLGTLFAPTKDRAAPGQGFTHRLGDEVTISAAGLGSLHNVVRHSHQCPPWTFGVNALMKNLAARGLL